RSRFRRSSTAMTTAGAPPPPPRRPPPPLPPRARVLSPPLPSSRIPNGAPAVPSADGIMSTGAQLSLADIAMQLRDEQLEARVIHYKAELATNSELDAITAQVVAELQLLQKTAAATIAAQPDASPADRAQMEIELIENLKQMLSRLFRPDQISSIMKRKLGEISKRFARLFFESELHDKMHGEGDTTRTMRHPEQALYHLIARHEPELMKELDAFEYESPAVNAQSKEMLTAWTTELRNAFLGRNTPELNALVKMLNQVLTQFFVEELPPKHGELAWEIVREAQLASSKVRAGYKVSADAFPRFRKSFETRFLQRLVTFATEAMLERLRAKEGNFRSETIRFVADPHIYSDICELVCDAVYDYLYSEGFLDLPNDWKDAAPA
ncbi:MAG: hypothetical protein ABI461_15450, partial [Polyangiaceae bacterium]